MNKSLNPKILRERTKQFALRIIKVADALPRTAAGRTIGNPLIRSGTSVGAKLHIVLEEADESMF